MAHTVPVFNIFGGRFGEKRCSLGSMPRKVWTLPAPACFKILAGLILGKVMGGSSFPLATWYSPLAYLCDCCSGVLAAFRQCVDVPIAISPWTAALYRRSDLS